MQIKNQKIQLKQSENFLVKQIDPIWDEIEDLKEKIILYNNENAKLIEQALKLEDELKTLTRTKKIDQLYNSIELDKNGLIGSKYLIEKLSGNKKFDVDEKFEKDGLIKLIETIVEPHSDEENELIEKMTESLTGENPVYKEDLENPLYLKIVQYFKDLKEANKEAQKKKK